MKVLITVGQSLFGGPQLDLLCKCDFIASAHIKLLHVMEPIAWQSMTVYPTHVPPAEIVDRECRRAAESALENVANTLKSRCDTKSIELELREGDVVKEVLNVSEEWDADLILVGTPEMRGLGKLFESNASHAASSHPPRFVLIARRYEESKDRS